MEYVNSCIGCTKTVFKSAAKDPPRTLRRLSGGSGILLILAGIAGIFTINPLSLIISVYTFFFGVLIVLTELKSLPIIKTFQRRVDIYFHLLSVPRAKGGFYCFVGLLTCFSTKGLSFVCVVTVTVIGVLHLFACKRCGAPGDEEQGEPVRPMEVALADGSSDPPLPDTWQGLMKQVVSESPEMLTAGLSTLGGAAGAAGGVMNAMNSGSGPAPPAPGPAPATRSGGGMRGSDVVPPPPPEPAPQPPPPPPQSPPAQGAAATSSSSTNMDE